MPFVLAGLLVVLAALHALGVTSLLAWTLPVIDGGRYPALFAAYFATWLVARQLRGDARRTALLLGSFVTAAVFDLAFLVASLVWICGLHALLPRVRLALVYVIATYTLVIVHPQLDRFGYLLAISYTFRIAWLLHQVRLQREPLALADVVLYFVFAPFFVIVPYMIAIPRFDGFRGGIERHDLAIERSGLRMIAWGIVLALAGWAVRELYGPSALGLTTLADGELAMAFVHGFFSYMLEHLLYALAIAAILVGMVRALGFDLAPSFDQPLRSESVNEWWRRWNTHFRDLLVELFYYPVVLRLRRRRTLATIAGCASVFLVGSPLFHIPKHVFEHGHTFPIGVFMESVVILPLVAASLVRRREAPAKNLAHRGLRVAVTLLLVYIAVVIIGRGVQRAVLGGT
jgi:D-alanyl-lipoteichoic acid acyltransferase DltB (MBOAT superfamily)